MNINLYCNNREKAITLRRKQVIDRFVDYLFESDFGKIYQRSDVDHITIHYKGHPDVEALLVLITLNFIDSRDVIEDIESRLKKIPEYMSSNIVGFYENGTGFNFWLELSEEDRKGF